MTAGWSRIAGRRRRPPSAAGRAGRTRTSSASPRSASEAGSLHQRPDRRVGGVRHGLEGRLDRGQDAPDVGHDRREREVLVVGVAAGRSTAMPWTHRTNWSRSPRRPSRRQEDEPDDDADGERSPPSAERRRPPTSGPSRRGPAVIGSDAAGDPVPLGAIRRPRRARRSSRPYARTASAISLRAVEQPLDLALVEVDAGDLALELVGDVGVFGEIADVGREARRAMSAPRSSRPRKSVHQAYGKSS